MSTPFFTPGRAAEQLRLVLRILLVRLRLLAVPAAAFAIVVAWPVLRATWDRLTRGAIGRDPSTEAVSLDTEYFCPMCPGVVSDWPAKCPVCNMSLVRRKRGEAVPLPDGVLARMQLSPYRIQLAGIQTSPIAYQPLAQEIVTAGFAAADDSSTDLTHLSLVAEVFAKDVPFLTEGRAAEIACDVYPGHPPFAGRVRSVTTLAAGGTSVFRAHLDIDNPERELRPGFLVTARVKVPVQQVEPFRSMPAGAPPLQTGELRQVFVCPEHPDTLHETPGRCPIDRQELQPRPLAANQRLRWWCPMHPKVTADRPGAECRECNGMKLVLRIVTYNPPGEVLAVPESAVVDTGAKKVVYVERMPGMFDGVEVVLGPRCGSSYPVVRGLEAGDLVATTGAFLIDAETHLNPGVAAGYFGAARGDSERKAPTPSAPARPDQGAIALALSKLSAADQAQAAKQKVCPVTGEVLGSMGTPPVVVVEGKRVFLCCKGCEAALRKEPGKFLSKLEDK